MIDSSSDFVPDRFSLILRLLILQLAVKSNDFLNFQTNFIAYFFLRRQIFKKFFQLQQVMRLYCELYCFFLFYLFIGISLKSGLLTFFLNFCSVSEKSNSVLKFIKRKQKCWVEYAQQYARAYICVRTRYLPIELFTLSWTEIDVFELEIVLVLSEVETLLYIFFFLPELEVSLVSYAEN